MSPMFPPRSTRYSRTHCDNQLPISYLFLGPAKRKTKEPLDSGLKGEHLPSQRRTTCERKRRMGFSVVDPSSESEEALKISAPRG